jgi:hypothetical protein
MTAQPLRNVTSTEADIRFNLEMRNHVSLGVAVNRLGTDCKDQGKFPCCQEPFRSAQVVKNIGSTRSGSETRKAGEVDIRFSVI